MSLSLNADNASEWLNEEIFSKVIENDLKIESNDFKIISMDSKLATKPGDNYMALLFRSSVKIELNSGEVKSLSYIVKCLLLSEFRESMVVGFNAFPKEMKMYSTFLPAFEELYAKVGVEVTFGPKCFYSTDKPTQIIVLEDLSGFTMVDRKLGLDKKHVEWGLTWLSKFHAASMVYRERNGSFGEDFETGVFNPAMDSTFQPFYDGYFDHYIAALKKLDNGEKYAEKAEILRGDLYLKICKALEYDEKAFNVLCHGDMWTNNLLFLYNQDGEIEKQKAVDFQVLFWGSVAKDIYYFMMSSWQLDFKVHKFDELTKFYFDGLVDNLKVLEYSGKMPTYEDLKKELTRMKLLAAGLTVEILTFTCCEVDASNENWAKMIYDNPKAKKSLAEVIPWLDERNAFEI